MAEQHRHQLRPASEAARMTLGLVIPYRSGKLSSRDELQQLRENAAYSIHGGGLLKVDADSCANPTSTYQTRRLIPQALIWTRVPADIIREVA
jgi:hypothetical protein